MQHRNLNTEEWSRMAIDSLFDRGKLRDWQEFAHALKGDATLARETLVMAGRHAEQGAAELARVLVEHFHPNLAFVLEPQRLQQRAEFLALRDRLGTASEEEIARRLAEREPVEPEPELDAETISKFRALIEQSKGALASRKARWLRRLLAKS